jgi:transposase
MGSAPVPLASLSEEQRAEAHARFEMLRPALEEGVSQAQIARTHQLSKSAVQRWVKRYREQGLAGLVTTARKDKGKSRRLPAQAITLVEGLALQTPPRSAAAIHRQVVEIAKAQGWNPPSYERVRQIIKSLDPALMTLAHQEAAAYREEFDLLYRREATHANAMWQADHTPLDVWLLDEEGKPAKPYLTAIEDDYSRMIVKEVMTLFAAYAYLAEAAHQRHHPSEEFVVTRRYPSLIELLIVDEANRLKDMALEQIRDIADRGEIGLVLLGMPGLDKRLQRVAQLYSRIGFVHEMEPLSQQETRFFLQQRWSHRVAADSEDFTDQEAVATIIRITQGNLRLIDRLMKQVERVLIANQLTVVTKEVVETARQNLIIGFN